MPDIEVRPFTEATNVTGRQGAIVERSLRAGRRHFGVAAASLTWMDSPGMKDHLPEGWKHEVLDSAMVAERRTSEQVLQWMEDKPNVVLLDSLHIKGAGKEIVDPETGLVEAGDTDHIIMIGNYVVVLDTKHWRTKARYMVSDEGHVLRNNKEFAGGDVHIGGALHLWLDYFDNRDVELVGAVSITNDKDPETIKVFRNRNWYTKYWYLLEPDRFVQWLDEKYAELVEDRNGAHDATFIDSGMVAQAAVCCQRPWSRRDGLINVKAMEASSAHM